VNSGPGNQLVQLPDHPFPGVAQLARRQVPHEGPGQQPARYAGAAAASTHRFSAGTTEIMKEIIGRGLGMQLLG
jgi:hypothetical protein